ncbi:MAG: hypothetical protein ACKO81_10065, partial [Planctomycetota bacterium]
CTADCERTTGFGLAQVTKVILSHKHSLNPAGPNRWASNLQENTITRVAVPEVDRGDCRVVSGWLGLPD